MARTFLLVILLATFATPAYAYIDAGLGSLVLQSLVAGFFTFLVVWRSWLEKFKNFFRRRPLAGSAQNSAEE